MDGLIRRGDVWWTDLPTPIGSEPGFRRPVVVVQSDALNDTGTATVVAVPLTSNLDRAGYPWTLELPPEASGLRQASVALAHQVAVIDRSSFRARVGRLAPSALEQIYLAIDLALGR